MNQDYTHETGITPTVQTLFSRYSLINLIEIICDKKITGIISWLETKKIQPKNCLIIGSYLTGLRLANHLIYTSKVTVLDIYPHIQGFLNPEVHFVTDYKEVVSQSFDVIIDTSGLGGIKPEQLSCFHPSKACIIEDPCSEGSDAYIRNMHLGNRLLEAVKVKNKGMLYTEGLNSKTSGTMTLTIEVIKKSMEDALTHEGVLYSTSFLEFFERILFKEKNHEAFFFKLIKPALVVSTLKECNLNTIIEKNLAKIESTVCERPPGLS